jgi:uncharacterized protein
MALNSQPAPHPKVWIDLDNTPHVPFFVPIIEELKKSGCDVMLTARDAFQVCELAGQKGLQYTRVGAHHGRHALLKVAGLFLRAAQLLPHVRRERPDLAVSHGARAQFIACNLLRIPSLLIDDYEHSKYPPFMRPDWALVPKVIPAEAVPFARRGVRHYPGIKEDVYAHNLAPDAGLLRVLGISPDELLITVRPPATEAHYHDRESEELFVEFIEHALGTASARVVLLPRNKNQGTHLRSHHPAWFRNGRCVIPDQAVDGLSLVWCSDLVMSGGGTMCREAAALGVPVYSVFRGPLGAVDRSLESDGKLTILRSRQDVRSKVTFVRRHRGELRGRKESHAQSAIQPPRASSPALTAIVQEIHRLLAEVRSGAGCQLTTPASVARVA